VEFEHIISAGERPKTYALDRAATGTGFQLVGLFVLARQSPVGQGLFIHKVSRSHTTTHYISRTALDE